MTRARLTAGCGTLLVLLAATAPVAGADPDPAPGAVAYLIGRCYTPEQPIVEEPTEVVYNCDSTSIMRDMQWSMWGPDGAAGTGTDDSVQCRPNCAQGPHLINPIVVRAWNPQPPATPGCPDGVQFYRDLTVAYPQGVPPWVTPGTRWNDTVEYVYVDGMPAVHFTDQGPYSCTPLPMPS